MERQTISDIKGTLGDYGKWVEANSSKKFSLFDYLHALSRHNKVKPDFIVALFALLWPEFYETNEQVFLAEEFSQERYKQNERNPGVKGAEYFMNTTPISEIFAGLDFKTQKVIGEMIVDAWRAKLKLNFPNMQFIVKCYEDEPEDLWCCFYQAKKP